MIETVFALILTLNGNMIEHVYKPTLSDCLKSKRIAQNEVNPERVVLSVMRMWYLYPLYMTIISVQIVVKRLDNMLMAT
jgi:hypothetical protein